VVAWVTAIVGIGIELGVVEELDEMNVYRKRSLKLLGR